jgi:hypothetical protein
MRPTQVRKLIMAVGIARAKAEFLSCKLFWRE